MQPDENARNKTPNHGCVCERQITRQAETLKCIQCEGQFHTACMQARHHYHENIDISEWNCPFCTNKISYPIASKCAPPETLECSALIAILGFMSALPSKTQVNNDELYSQFKYVACLLLAIWYCFNLMSFTIQWLENSRCNSLL